MYIAGTARRRRAPKSKRSQASQHMATSATHINTTSTDNKIFTYRNPDNNQIQYYKVKSHKENKNDQTKGGGNKPSNWVPSRGTADTPRGNTQRQPNPNRGKEGRNNRRGFR